MYVFPYNEDLLTISLFSSPFLIHPIFVLGLARPRVLIRPDYSFSLIRKTVRRLVTKGQSIGITVVDRDVCSFVSYTITGIVL